jgi:ABC-type branched-subunit amino acid transport system ATPase component/ABC-type branched-subunit amino acid transport system permease subunit
MTATTVAVAPFGVEVPLAVLVLGAIVGLTYGLLAVGIVVVYRSSRIVNFAHGEIGAFAAAIFGVAVTRWHVPYYVALPGALAVGAGVAAVSEVAVVRRLRHAPRLMSVVATLGVGQLLVALAAAFNPRASVGQSYPSPPGLPEFDLGSLRVNQAYMGMLVFAPLAAAGVSLLLSRTRLGVAVRSAAANPEAARMAGIFATRMSSLTWALAGMLSALTAVLVLPSRGVVSGESFGPTLLLRALAVAVLAGMNSLVGAMAAGVVLGVVEQVLLWNDAGSGVTEVVLFVVILGALVLRRVQVGEGDDKGSWAAVQQWRQLPDAVARLPLVRSLGWIVGVGGVAVMAALPLLASNSTAITLVGMIGFAIVGLSVGIVAGLGGQLSLGQFALAAIGAWASYEVVQATGNFPLGFLAAGAGAAAASVVIGLPAVRTRGLLFTVTTLSFALVLPAWLAQRSWMFGSSVEPGRPIIFGRALDTGHEYYYFALVVLIAMLLLARNVRRGGFARQLVAVRDNEESARGFTIPARAVKLKGFLVAGFVAGVGGAVYGHALSLIGPSTFPTRASIDVVAMTVVGGIGVLAGPLLGVLYVIGVPELVPLDSAGIAATRLGWLVLILYLPGGVAQVFQPLRDRLVELIARRRGIELSSSAWAEAGIGVDGSVPGPGTARLDVIAAATAARAGPDAASADSARAAGRDGQDRPSPQLHAVDLRKSFGGVRAVDGVTITVEPGEIVGLIGPNGAGKTTTFELLGGFRRPDTGRVELGGVDVTRLGPEERGRRGLIRSFQDATLFPTMTVLDAVRLGFERVRPTRLVATALGWRESERDKDRLAREVIASMGLDAYRNRAIQELSTGTRRLTELACLIALQPTLLLLDEPSSGIAQRESEALGGLLRDLRDELGITLLVIEHDIPLVMGISDRVVVMDTGRIIADGPPDAVRRDPRVLDSYLGAAGDPSVHRAIGEEVEPPAPPRPTAVAGSACPPAGRSAR